jgi:lipoprotein-releasing system permease protein
MKNRLPLMLMLALRDVSRHWVILLFTFVSLSVLFTAVFLTGGVLDGFRQAFENGATTTEGHIKIKPQESSGGLENIGLMAEKVRQIPNIAAATIRSYGLASLGYEKTVLGPYVLMGVMPEEASVTLLPRSAIDGAFLIGGHSENGVVLGRTLADALVGLEYDNEMIVPGETVVLESGTGIRKEYVVSGILDAKTFHPNWMMYLPRSEVDFLDGTGRDSEIVVKLEEPLLLEETKEAIENQIPGVRVITWREDTGYISDALGALGFVADNIISLLLLVSFVVTGVIIFTNVFQRRRQIAVLKSMGATSLFVVIIYVFEALVYSLISFSCGLLCFMLIYSISLQHPLPLLIGDFYIVFEWQRVLMLFGLIVGSALLGGFIPALSAAKTKPADVMRSAG